MPFGTLRYFHIHIQTANTSVKHSLSAPVVVTETVLDLCKANFFPWHVKPYWCFIYIDYVVKTEAVFLSLLRNGMMEVQVILISAIFLRQSLGEKSLAVV